MTTFYHVQVGALETQEFRTTPAPFWLVCFSDTIKCPMREMYFVVLLGGRDCCCAEGGEAAVVLLVLWFHALTAREMILIMPIDDEKNCDADGAACLGQLLLWRM
jgi:hypothetical protein